MPAVGGEAAASSISSSSSGRGSGGYMVIVVTVDPCSVLRGDRRFRQLEDGGNGFSSVRMHLKVVGHFTS